MRARHIVLLPVVLVVLAACTQSGSTPTEVVHHRARGPADLLVLESKTGLISVDAATGETPFTGPGIALPTDWFTVYTTAHEGGSTILRTVQAATGRTVGMATVRGNWDVRVASPTGERVALMAPFRPGRAPWSPGPRTSTSIVVADPSGAHPAMRFDLRGNFDPEAFSTDGKRLFMISYLPPSQPTSYRVVGLNLKRGTVFPLFGREKQWVGRMSGTRLMQTPAPDGMFLFTLYSSQPAENAKGYDDVQASAARPVAFVHTLNLDFGQAVCVGLPKALWGGNPRYEAIVSSGADARVYVVDTSRGIVAVLSSDTLDVIQTAKADFGLPAVGSQTEAALSPDGRALYVSTGKSIVTLDAMTLVPLAKWNLPSPASGLGVTLDGERLYVAMPGRVEALNAATGASVWSMRVPGVQGIRSVSSAA
jgi:hypothetical protein